MTSNKRALRVLLAWSGLLALVMVAALLFTTPQPSSAQTGVAAFSTLRVGKFYRAFPRSAISVTMNAFITPTGTFQRLESFGTVATSGASIDVLPAGTIVYLVNVGAGTITFSETGTLISAGNIVLGPEDAAQIISDGTNYRQIGASNN
jgi:hypothetical protein